MGELPEKRNRRPLQYGPVPFVPQNQINFECLSPRIQQKLVEEQTRRKALEAMEAERQKWEGVDKLGWLYELVPVRRLAKQNCGWRFARELYSALTLANAKSEILIQMLAHDVPMQHQRWLEFRIKHPERMPTDEEVEQAWLDIFPKRTPSVYPDWAMPLPINTRAFYLRIV